MKVTNLGNNHPRQCCANGVSHAAGGAYIKPKTKAEGDALLAVMQQSGYQGQVIADLKKTIESLPK